MRECFTTDEVPASDRFAYWREVICAVYVKLGAEPVGADPFSGSVHVGAWDDVIISRVRAGAQLVTHDKSDPRDDCLMSLQLAGSGVVSQDGRDAVLGAGDFALYDATRPYRLTFDDSFEQIVVQFPRQLLVDRNIDLARAAATRCRRGAGLTDVVSGLVQALDTQRDEVPLRTRSRMGTQVVDCLASALSLEGLSLEGLSLEGGGAAGAEPLRATRRQMILDYAAVHLADPQLSVSRIADEFGCSPRSLQHLFADGPTLSARIRTIRLERAFHTLQDPLYVHHTIARIGADHGFGDPAAFARAFRREFGRAPSDIRAEFFSSSPPPA